MMSIFITGMGEVYSGSPQQGIVLALIRAASALAIPFYSMINAKSFYLNEIFFSILFFLLITIFSPLNAFFISFRKKNIIVSKYISAKSIILFAIFNLLLTAISVSVFFSFFPIIQAADDYPPIIVKGDIAVVKKIGNQFFKNGEMIVLNDKGLSFVRVIGQPEEDVSYSKGRFSVQGSELLQSIFTENELKEFSLTDFDVISETHDNLKYPVLQNKDQYKMNITLEKNQYFAAPDDRTKGSGFIAVKKEDIYGKMEGLILSFRRVKFLIKPFHMAE